MQSNPQIANFCLGIVSPYIYDSVKWNEFARYRDSIYSALICRTIPLTRKNENGEMVSVVPMKNGFFLHMKLVFDYPKTSNLQSITMHFYDQEELLLRVDWSYKEYLLKKHPQPHWHMHSKSSIITDNGVSTMSYSNYNTFLTYHPKDIEEHIIDVNRLHLYMAYNKENQSCIDFREKNTLVQWLNYTMKYLDEHFCALKDYSE